MVTGSIPCMYHMFVHQNFLTQIKTRVCKVIWISQVWWFCLSCVKCLEQTEENSYKSWSHHAEEDRTISSRKKTLLVGQDEVQYVDPPFAA